MKQNDKIAAALNEVDVSRRICEDEIRTALDKFISASGVRPKRVEFTCTEISQHESMTREFICGVVNLEYDPDVRFPTA